MAIKLDKDDPSWYSGPPYAVPEFVFDEYDLEGTYESQEVRDVPAEEQRARWTPEQLEKRARYMEILRQARDRYLWATFEPQQQRHQSQSLDPKLYGACFDPWEPRRANLRGIVDMTDVNGQMIVQQMRYAAG